MTDKQKLTSLINHFCDGNNAEFARQIDITAQTLNNWLNRGLSKDAPSKIVSRWNDVNLSWLLTGEGTMLNEEENMVPEIIDEEDDADDDLVPLLPVEAMAGSLSCYSEGVYLRDCQKIKSPVNGADWAIRISGDSMEPELHNGYYIFISKLSGAFIPWGHAVVLDTIDGVVVKKIFPVEGTEEFIVAKSVNPDYPPFRIETSAILGIYRILGGSFINSTL